MAHRPFTEDEQTALRSLAEVFSDKESREDLTVLVREGTTLQEIILAYKINRRVIARLKTIGGLIVLAGTTVAALKGLNLWPK